MNEEKNHERLTADLSEYKIHIERRLTRLEVLIWLTIGLSVVGDFGIRIIDNWYLLGGLHP